jgi:hypothetical protein
MRTNVKAAMTGESSLASILSEDASEWFDIINAISL